jgi:hypothetical protein
MNPITSFLAFALVVRAFAVGYEGQIYLGLALLAVAAVIAASLKMANVWQKFVILRMGKLQSVRGAGLFAIIPVLDSLNPTAATLGFAVAGNDRLANDGSPAKNVALASRGVLAANGALEPDGLPHPAAA